MSDFGVLVDFLSRTNYIDLLYWVVGGTFAFFLIFFISRLARDLFGSRVRQIKEFGMDFDAVAKMLEKGLLTEEEAKRVKSVLGRHFSQLAGRPTGQKASRSSILSAETELAAAIAQVEQSRPVSLPGKPTFAGSGKGPAGQAPPPPPQSAKPTESRGAPDESRDQALDPEAVQLPPDILDMYEAGMITDDELQALRRFYAARSRSPK